MKLILQLYLLIRLFISAVAQEIAVTNLYDKVKEYAVIGDFVSAIKKQEHLKDMISLSHLTPSFSLSLKEHMKRLNCEVNTKYHF